MLTGAFVIGIDIKPTVDAGSRVEHTTVVVDYDSFEGRMGTLVEHSVHGMGFRRADNDLIAFDADCATRSQMTMNMNGRCRDPTTGHVDHTKPGADEAARRDRIDSKTIQWMDSVLRPHSDAECIAHATTWPHGPGGWGFSDTDAHTILVSPPRWDPDNTTVREEDRLRARSLYQRRCRNSRTTPGRRGADGQTNSGRICDPPTNTQDPSHAGTPADMMPPTHRDALALPDDDLAMHAGEQIFGVSRYSEEDPDRSRNDLGSMHTFSAVSPKNQQ